jgi:hypothetical protein
MKVKLSDLNLKLDSRASAWKSGIDKIYTVPKLMVDRYIDHIPNEDDSKFFLCREKISVWSFNKDKYYELISFSLGSYNKFVKDNPLVEINEIIYKPFYCKPIRGKRFYIGFEPI